MKKYSSLIKGAILASLLVSPLTARQPPKSRPSSLENQVSTTQPASQSNPYQTNDFKEDSDKILLARMLYGETGGRLSLDETVAIANTAVRRSKDGKKWNGETLRSAILAPKQYSCFNSNDPMLRQLKNPYANNKEGFDRCLEIAEGVLSGKYQDTSKGATHYFNPKKASPHWARAMQKIGHIKIPKGQSVHVFYKDSPRKSKKK